MNSDLHTLTGVYAMDALPDDERAAFETHLAGCDSCRAEVHELTATAARLGAAVAVTLPPALKDRVLATVATARQAPPEARPEMPAALGPAGRHGAGRRVGRRRPWYREPLAVAASVLLVLSLALGGAVVVQQRELGRAAATAQAIAEVTADPARVDNSAPVRTGGSATVVAAGGRAVFAARSLPALPEDRAYQLWVLGPDEIRSAGLLPVHDGVARAYIADLGDGESVAVSVEPARGSAQPTTDPIAVLPVA